MKKGFKIIQKAKEKKFTPFVLKINVNTVAKLLHLRHLFEVTDRELKENMTSSSTFNPKSEDTIWLDHLSTRFLDIAVEMGVEE